MKKKVVCILLLVLCLTTGCDSNAGKNEITISETAAEITEVTSEIIHMNNCGGKANTEQEAKRSRDIKIEGTGTFGLAGPVAKGEISAKYGETTGVSKSLKLIAPSGTNMEFTLEWTEKTWVGIITNQGNDEKADYKVSVPISVELVSTQDIGGCNFPTITNTPIIPTEEIPTNTPEPIIETIPPTETPIRPTDISNNTDPESLLSVGETWTTDGFSVLLQGADFKFGDEMDLQFVFTNNTGKTLFFNYNETSNVIMKNNTGKLFIWDSLYQKDIVLENGESFTDVVFKGGNFSNSEYFIISVNLPGIISAKWRYN